MGLLYALSIPWYRSGGAPGTPWLGLPDWVTVALLCYVGAAFANAGAWLLAEVPDAAPSDAPADPQAESSADREPAP